MTHSRPKATAGALPFNILPCMPQHFAVRKRCDMTGGRDEGRGTIPRRIDSRTGSHSLVMCQTDSLVHRLGEASHLHVLSSRESRLCGDD